MELKSNDQLTFLGCHDGWAQDLIKGNKYLVFQQGEKDQLPGNSLCVIDSVGDRVSLDYDRRKYFAKTL